jgi:gliding motility-associated-like protein
MKYFIFLMSIWAIFAGRVFSQNFGMIRFLDCGEEGVIQSLMPVEGKDFFAIKNPSGSASPFGEVRFTPDGSPHWHFHWQYEGVNQSVVYEGDSTYMTVALKGNGVYAFRAEKEGTAAIEATFIVFYDYLDFAVSISNEMDCEYIQLDLAYGSLPAYGSYPGAQQVLYTVLWDGKERELMPFPDYSLFHIAQLIGGEDPVDHDVTCRVKIKDRFGFEWVSDEVTYHSYVPRAGFSVDPQQGEAPLEVSFHNESVNAQRFEWYLYRDTTDIRLNEVVTLEDSLLGKRIYTGEYLSPYTYEHPGNYNVKLVVVNTMGINQCADTVSLESYIVVDSSLVDVPNVFTPNGDGMNDIFKVKTRSLENFQGVILNRWGRKVYEWTDPQGGWDGRIHGKYATPGTYFYIITARGREKNNPPRYVKKGAVMLIR